jgi:UDP-glucose 4-epimerase
MAHHQDRVVGHGPWATEVLLGVLQARVRHLRLAPWLHTCLPGVMDDCDARFDVRLPAGVLNALAQVRLLGEKEEPFVEPADVLECLTPDRESRSCRPVEGSAPRVAVEVQDTLPKPFAGPGPLLVRECVRELPSHGREPVQRRPKPPIARHLADGDEPRRGPLAKGIHEELEGPAHELGVRIQEEQVLGIRTAGTRVVCGAEAPIRRVEDADPGGRLQCDRKSAVLDNCGPIRALAGGVVERLDAARQPSLVSVGHNDDFEIHHRSINGRPDPGFPPNDADLHGEASVNLSMGTTASARATNSMLAVKALETTSLAGARVLLTGASGLLGRHVLKVIGREADVVALSRSPHAHEGRVQWLVCDLAQPGALADVVRSVHPEFVIHLAGAVRGDRSLDAVAPTLRANLVGTVELLEAATRAGCRRIVLSGSLLEEPARGGTQAVPPSPYGASRWAASAYGRMFHALFDAPVVILRPAFAYGPGQEPTKLIPYVITALLEGRSVELSSGERLLDCVYAEDVARAYVVAAALDGVDGRTIDIGSGVLTSVRQIVELIVDAVGPTAGHPVFGALPLRPLEQDVEVDAEETARILGWRATTTLEDGVRATVAYLHRELDAGRALST